jgi:hypothetical protein
MEGGNLEVQSKQIGHRQSAGRLRGKFKALAQSGRWASTNEFYFRASRFLCGIFAGRRTPRLDTVRHFECNGLGAVANKNNQLQ